MRPRFEIPWRIGSARPRLYVWAPPAVKWPRAPSPARRGFVVALARLDPALASESRFLFPERRLRLQEIHHETAGIEGLATMRARHCHQHDLVGRTELAHSMDDEDVENVESSTRSGDDRIERL